ncbi:hypothetical protein [Pseudomonas abyssi]|uniref:hypothetical protein n=1 Tax=Pseudomonas abyssi TaxID=170540 RepID=UPI000E4EE3E7|nr:hypothetical protein [Halopseudomonas gallaeciensis]
MAVYCVTYDLKSPGQDYDSVHEYIKKFAYCKHLESFWLIDTTKTAGTIRDELEALVDSNDTIFVARLQEAWASLNYGCTNWLKSDKRNW